MRRSSYTPEPLIVVEEAIKEDDEKELEGAVGGSDNAPSDEDYDDDTTDPAFLCPWRDARDMRKRSLPTPSCTSGITASQVRRLSEGRQSEIAKETAFLATLTTNPTPGRRHSVTISKFPPTGIFNRGRRESFAAFPVARRDSSSFNLHLDIMDDIAEIKGARKAKMKIYKTDSREQVCEIEESGTCGSPVRFQSMVCTGTLRTPAMEVRRHSEAAGLASLVPSLAVQPKRKSSEQLCVVGPGAAGIVCTNSDLKSLLSLTSSAQEINTGADDKVAAKTASEEESHAEKRSRLKDSRSSSFDMAILQQDDGADGDAAGGATQKSSKVSPTSWFAKRHQPMAKKEEVASKPETPKVTFTAPEEVTEVTEVKAGRSKRSQSCVETAKRLVWDRPSGSVVDAHILGSAIEDFLRRGSDPEGIPAPEDKEAEAKGAEKEQSSSGGSSSICSTLKDLFVK
ncbi:uncharacterized protein LOC132204657 [Neocloeon triangulifer]|uniref:uncharacterized protein LOC132204657 n=1 Tax=Neocloeon triangulifer TaxID=2078957 RepID=UPI00286F467A|nr:uncharacterized protein LOC132204657 [Neocloeon triangulifer]XP_059489266.1 uncharacterized protein LOC132204657 [Neocloeon triangulifer]